MNLLVNPHQMICLVYTVYKLNKLVTSVLKNILKINFIFNMYSFLLIGDESVVEMNLDAGSNKIKSN